MAYTRFNKFAYIACDPTTKDLLIRYLNKQGIYALAEEKRDADVKGIIPTKDSKKIFYEGEIKTGWTGDWPEKFETVDIPYRKKKLLTKHGKKNLWFWVIAGDLKHAWEIKAKYLTEKHTGRKNTTRRPNEKFYQIPIKHCKLLNLEEVL